MPSTSLSTQRRRNIATAERAVALIAWVLPMKYSINHNFIDQTPLIELTAFNSGAHAGGDQDRQDTDFESDECFSQLRLRKAEKKWLNGVAGGKQSHVKTYGILLD